MSWTPDNIAAAVQVLTQAGARFSLPEDSGSKSVSTAAQFLDVRPEWIKQHLDEFPGWYRLPAAAVTLAGRTTPVGEIRIPARDLVEFERRRRKARAA